MKIFSIILIAFLIQVSVSAWFGPESETETVVPGGEVEDTDDETVETKEKYQSDPDEDDEDDLDAENGSPVHNQDDDTDGMETTVQPNPQNAGQPNPDQTRVYSGYANPENQPQYTPQPEYTPISSRDIPQGCHGGQYQCQKTDPKAQTRCIPQEWRCNGLRDCELNDDESSCTTDQLTRGRTQTKCTHEQYQCHGSGINSIPPHCIDRRQVCDGTYQCSYGDDEANCHSDRSDRNRPSVYPNNRIPPQSPDQTRDNSRVEPRVEPRVDPRESARVDPRDSRDRIDQYRPQTSTGDRKSEEYVQRLEWRDRCFRSCLKY